MNSVTPPPVLAGTQLLAYVTLDKTIAHTGKSTLYVDGKQIGAVPCLAITQEEAGAALLLFCDDRWNPVGVVECESFTDAQKRAESEYKGLAGRWTIVGVTKEAAAQYIRDQGNGLRCSFCGKSAEMIKHLMSGPSANICDECIKDFYEELQEDEK